MPEYWYALADRQRRRLSYFEAEQQNKPLPVTVFLGGPPAMVLSAIAPLPEDVPELMLASRWRIPRSRRSKSDERQASIDSRSRIRDLRHGRSAREKA